MGVRRKTAGSSDRHGVTGNNQNCRCSGTQIAGQSLRASFCLTDESGARRSWAWVSLPLQIWQGVRCFIKPPTASIAYLVTSANDADRTSADISGQIQPRYSRSVLQQSSALAVLVHRTRQFNRPRARSAGWPRGSPRLFSRRCASSAAASRWPGHCCGRSRWTAQGPTRFEKVSSPRAGRHTATAYLGGYTRQ